MLTIKRKLTTSQKIASINSSLQMNRPIIITPIYFELHVLKLIIQTILVTSILLTNHVSASANNGDENISERGVPIPAKAKDSLEQVQLIFRHGLRSPNRAYPGDPYSDLSYWPQGWGQLTNLGKKQQFELGQFIRERYIDFLAADDFDEGYSPKKFQAFSSDSDRTIMSVLANIAGLFPPTVKENWTDDQSLRGWQPIPVRALPKNSDKIILGSASCPKFDKLWANLLSSPEFHDLNANYRPLYDYIGNYTGEKYLYPIDLTSFYEALIIQEAHSLQLPDWTRKVYPTKVSSEFLGFAFSLVTHTEEMKRLRGGPLLFEMLTHMKNKITTTTTARARSINKGGNNNYFKMIMFSGHDITLARILGTLNIFNPPHLPDFNSLLMIELHRNESMSQVVNDSDAFYIEIYYRNGFVEPVKLEIDGCPEPCTINKFENVFKTRLITTNEWHQECLNEVEKARDEAETTTVVQKDSKPAEKQYEYTLGYWSNFYNALRSWYI